MINLARTEILRHLNWILLFAAADFLVLYYLFTLGVTFTSGQGATTWMLSLVALALTFGIFQMKLHRRSNDWVYLMHRPLPPGSIHAALTLGGGALLALALLLPALCMLAVMQADGRPGIELRHYKMLGFGSALVFTAYAVGQFAVLGSSRLAFFALSLLAVFIYQPFEHSERLVSHTLVTIFALAAAHAAFRPDPARPQARIGNLLLTEFPVVLGCYLLIGACCLGYMMNTSTRGVIRSAAPATFNGVIALDGAAQLQLALERSAHPDAAFLAQQARLAEVIPIIAPQRMPYPRRHQLPLDDEKTLLQDPDSGATWMFRHAAMLYEGFDASTGTRIGWLAPDGFHAPDAPLPTSRFADVPLATTNDFLVTRSQLYQIDWKERAVHLRFTNPAPDEFTDTLSVSTNVATLFSTRQLFFFSTGDLLDPAVALEPRAVLDVQVSTTGGQFRGFHVLELIDGYLAALVIDGPPLNNLIEYAPNGKGHLQVWRAVPGNAELIADMPLGPDRPDAVVFADFMLAPAPRVFFDALWGIKFDKSAERTFPLLHAAIPAWVLLVALMLCTVCASLTALLLRASKLPAQVRRFWIGVGALCGVAGLLAFLLGYYWHGHERLQLPLRLSRSQVPA